MGDLHPFPGLECFRLLDQVLAPSAEGDEIDLHDIQLNQILVGGELGVENQGGK